MMHPWNPEVHPLESRDTPPESKDDAPAGIQKYTPWNPEVHPLVHPLESRSTPPESKDDAPAGIQKYTPWNPEVHPLVHPLESRSTPPESKDDAPAGIQKYTPWNPEVHPLVHPLESRSTPPESKDDAPAGIQKYTPWNPEVHPLVHPLESRSTPPESKDDAPLESRECRVVKSTSYTKIASSSRRGTTKSPGPSRRSKSPASTSSVNGTPGSQLSTPRSGKSPSPSPTSPGSLRKQRISQHGGSSTSLSSTKVCSSMDENDGPGEEESEEGFQIPATITERYKVGRTIGDGNFAVVKECVERSTAREYALKIIKKSKCRGKEHMIQNEVSILRRVKHPNIVLLIEEMDVPTELYLVMELVKGGDLFDAITSTSKYTERDASGMLYNLASAIKYLHSLNIVHRDIKPENLLVYEHQDGSKSLKLGDFGLATIVDGPLYTVCGTPTYVAPEIIAETGYGLKVDIWAAGVITYILLCGFPPFRGSGDDQEVLFDQILMGQVDFPPPYWDNVSDSAKELINMMLLVNVDQRFSALQVLEHPWVNDDGLPENEHQLSVAGKIKKHFNTGPKPNSTAAGVSVVALDHGFTIKRSGSLDYYQQPGMYWIRDRIPLFLPFPSTDAPVAGAMAKITQNRILHLKCADHGRGKNETTALDKERQVFRRRRNQDVRSRYKAQPAPPELNSESEDYSPSSSETVRSPNSPF
ncbi:Serine/threonine-protein kinase DCLK1 [Microtus ochrogaster]|uniref:non-specific serine/threonine protein kinase n=1 Tax=Microtus ochrogaster TaxID=79684 RepID=A0A8J6GW94_MICOH|nr:Serine/threonine-protein kinase DCLK1 [Microtus ochrogaster]